MDFYTSVASGMGLCQEVVEKDEAHSRAAPVRSEGGPLAAPMFNPSVGHGAGACERQEATQVSD